MLLEREAFLFFFFIFFFFWEEVNINIKPKKEIIKQRGNDENEMHKARKEAEKDSTTRRSRKSTVFSVCVCV